MISVLSSHWEDRSNLDEKIFTIFALVYLIILPFAETIDGSIKIFSICIDQARAGPACQSI